jgi:hypothetical protein
MKLLIRGQVELEDDSFRLISLFMRDFLQPDKLAQDPHLDRWLKVVDRVKAGKWGMWADFTRRALLNSALVALSSTLERTLPDSDQVFLAACVEEFIEMHGASRLEKL